jgi:hypothetical protein
VNFDGVVDARDTYAVDAVTTITYSGTGEYRFLGVKRGTILVSGEDSPATQVMQWSLDQSALALPSKDVEYQIAGHAPVYRPKVEFDAVPTGGPKAWKGILLEGGAIWLVTDGSEPYFSSGR